LKERDHLGDLGAERIILKWISKAKSVDVDWIKLAQKRLHSQVLEKRRVP
jgi:hypothetical protein